MPLAGLGRAPPPPRAGPRAAQGRVAGREEPGHRPAWSGPAAAEGARRLAARRWVRRAVEARPPRGAALAAAPAFAARGRWVVSGRPCAGSGQRWGCSLPARATPCVLHSTWVLSQSRRWVKRALGRVCWRRTRSQAVLPAATRVLWLRGALAVFLDCGQCPGRLTRVWDLSAFRRRRRLLCTHQYCDKVQDDRDS